MNSLPSNDRYMVQLYIEVLKMVALRGYNILPYQAILDDEKKNDYYTRRGELDKVNYKNDDYIGKYIYSIYLKTLKINNQTSFNEGSLPPLRSLFNSIFSKNDEKLVVIFSDSDEEKSVSKETATKFLNTIQIISNFFYNTSDYCNSSFCKLKGIFITKNNLTPGNQAWLSQISIIEHFKDDSLFCSIAENIFCSRRKVLTSEQKKEFVKELGCSLSKIPSIPLDKDISFRFYGIHKNEIVKEERESIFPESLNQKSVSYRLCKNN